MYVKKLLLKKKWDDNGAKKWDNSLLVIRLSQHTVCIIKMKNFMIVVYSYCRTPPMVELLYRSIPTTHHHVPNVLNTFNRISDLGLPLCVVYDVEVEHVLQINHARRKCIMGGRGGGGTRRRKRCCKGWAIPSTIMNTLCCLKLGTKSSKYCACWACSWGTSPHHH